MSAKQLSIGALAQLSGCKVPTIRYYEDIGLLDAAARTDGGHRAYDDEAVRRVGFIRRSRELGFSLDEVRSLLTLSLNRDSSCAEIDELASAHLDDVEARLASLTAMRDALTDLIDQCRQTSVWECRIVEALTP